VDVTYCGDSGERKRKARRLPPCEIQDTETPDEEWIPKVERAGLAIITRDRHIETRTKEKRIVLECGARMFAIATERKLHNWDMLESWCTNGQRWRRRQKSRDPSSTP
jgi:hypothetical protein